VSGLALAFGSAAVVAAQPQDTFKPVTDIARESLPASPLLYTAYALVWLVLIGYVFLLWRRLDKVERELKDVNARIAKGK
jgi:CcmD family protein